MSFRDLPLRRKLMWIIALATGLGLGLSLVMQLATGLRSSRAAMQSQLVGIAQIVAANSVAAIQFDDAKAAAATLAGLEAQPEITRASLRRLDGRTFAHYPAAASDTADLAAPVADRLRVDGAFWDSWLRIEYPVRQDGDTLGSLTLVADLSAMWRQFYERIALAAATTAVAFVLAFALAARLQRSISEPILELAAAAEAVGADKNYARRVAVAQGDEVGHLATRFNAMLAELQTRDLELKNNRAQLEQQVDQRTTQLRLAKEQAESASRAKTRFLANMSHELRTPLNAVIGAAQLMKAGERDAERREQLVDAIQRSGTNLLGLIESILDLSRIEAGEMKLSRQDFHLVECLDAALATAGLAARGKGLQLACIVDPALHAWRQGDAARLRQVLLNLLGNAVKFTLEGEIVVRVEPGAAPNEVRISVTDTGIGIGAALLPRVFEPFRQADEGADRRFGGSGLGLAIVRQLVEAMGGRVGVSSQLGQGSRFEIVLPLPAAADAPAEPAPLHERVAYFEPHEASAQALHAILLRMGCAPQRCLDAAELQAWCRAADAPDQAGWLLACTDAPEIADLLDAAAEGIDARCVIGMSSTESHDAEMAREMFRLPRNVIKPVTRTALASRFVGGGSGGDSAGPTTMPSELMTDAELQALTHVLVVEDDSLNQTIVCGLLRHAGYRVSAVCDGSSAIEAMRRGSFDVVLMDWQMPDMDGLEVTRRVRLGASGERARQTPIVALTANAFAEDREACLAAGMNDFLTKPVLAASLMATIERWARRDRQPVRDSKFAAPARRVAPIGVARPAAPPPTPPTEPVVAPPIYDPRVLAALPMVADGTQPGYAQEVIDMFIDTAPQALTAVRRAESEGDTRTLQRLLHTLKSSGASVGALALAAVAARGEAHMRAGEPMPADTAACLQLEFERLGGEIERCRAAAPGSGVVV